MLRLVGFFALVLVAFNVLAMLPVVGPLLQRLGFLGYWVVAILVSVLVARASERLLESRRHRKRLRDLGAVDTPNNQGKLGLLYLQTGRLRSAVPLLEAAFRGQPEVSDWAYGLGRAKMAQRDYQAAGEYFARVVTDDPDHGFGGAFLGLAAAALALGRPEGALEALAGHELRRGKTPKGAYLRGRALKALGRKAEAREAFGEVLEFGGRLPAYQRREYLGLAWRAMLARLW